LSGKVRTGSANIAIQSIDRVDLDALAELLRRAYQLQSA
jgi:hypothetical protein